MKVTIVPDPLGVNKDGGDAGATLDDNNNASMALVLAGDAKDQLLKPFYQQEGYSSSEGE